MAKNLPLLGGVPLPNFLTAWARSCIHACNSSIIKRQSISRPLAPLVFSYKPDALLRSPHPANQYEGPWEGLGSCMAIAVLTSAVTLPVLDPGICVYKAYSLGYFLASASLGREILMLIVLGGIALAVSFCPLAIADRASLSICSAGGLHWRKIAKGSPSIAVLVNKVIAEDYVNVTSFSALANLML